MNGCPPFAPHLGLLWASLWEAERGGRIILTLPHTLCSLRCGKEFGLIQRHWPSGLWQGLWVTPDTLAWALLEDLVRWSTY